ncbi:hypothetical protein Tco_1499847 [Tanacetum coccineum]
MLVHYELIRADGSSKRYSSMIRMLQGIDREDLEALWRIVKAKYGDIRPEDEFERVLYGDLRVMFEPDIKSDVWRMLQGYRVTTWKLIDSSRVHFIQRISLTGFPAQSVGSSNTDVLDSPCLLVLITGTSQSRQHVNSVKQIHAIIDGKTVVISESSVRSDLLFNDEDGIACLTNDEIFENLALMGYQQLSIKLTFQKEPQIASLHIEISPTAAPQTKAHQTVVSQIIFHETYIEHILPSPTTYQRKRKTQKHRRTKKDTELPQTSMPLDHGADEAIHKEGVDSVERAITTVASLDAAQDRNGYMWQSQVPRHHGGTPAQTRSERVLAQPNEPPISEGHTSGSEEGMMEHTFELTDNAPSTPHDSPLTGGYTSGSDEGRMKLDEFITLCTKLSKHALDLVKEKNAQAVEILNLKKRFKKLERKRKSSISHPRRRKYRQVETSSDDDLNEEDASK